MARMDDPITTGPGNFLMNGRPHFVYELWSDTRCLYVGISTSLGSRISKHARSSWWREVRRVECDWYPDKLQAMLRETLLIENHQPVYNWQHTANAEGSRSGQGYGGVAWRKDDVVP